MMDDLAFNQLLLRHQDSSCTYNSQNPQEEDDDFLHPFQYDSFPPVVTRLPRTISEEQRGSALLNTQDFLGMSQLSSSSQLQHSAVSPSWAITPASGNQVNTSSTTSSTLVSPLEKYHQSHDFEFYFSTPSPSCITDSDIMAGDSPLTTATSPCPVEDQMPLFSTTAKKNSDTTTYITATSTASTPVASPYPNLIEPSLLNHSSNFLSLSQQLHSVSLSSSSDNYHTANTTSSTKRKPKREFKCKICLKTLTRKDSLKNHITSVHQKLKPYKCDHPECSDKRYSTSSDLRRHIRETHTNNKYYLCGGIDCNGKQWGCGKQFRRCYQMKSHWNSKRSQSKCGIPDDFDYVPVPHVNNSETNDDYH